MGQYAVNKRFWVTITKRTILSLLVAFALGLLFDRFVFEEYQRSGWAAGLVAIGLYVAAGLAIGLVNFVSGILLAAVWGAKEMRDAVLHDLRAAKLPPPDEYHAKRFDYLDWIASDEEYPADVRVRAAALYAAYTVAYQRAGFFNAVALAQAADDAVLRYAQEAPEMQKG